MVRPVAVAGAAIVGQQLRHPAFFRAIPLPTLGMNLAVAASSDKWLIFREFLVDQPEPNWALDFKGNSASAERWLGSNLPYG